MYENYKKESECHLKRRLITRFILRICRLSFFPIVKSTKIEYPARQQIQRILFLFSENPTQILSRITKSSSKNSTNAEEEQTSSPTNKPTPNIEIVHTNVPKRPPTLNTPSSRKRKSEQNRAAPERKAKGERECHHL